MATKINGASQVNGTEERIPDETIAAAAAQAEKTAAARGRLFDASKRADVNAILKDGGKSAKHVVKAKSEDGKSVVSYTLTGFVETGSAKEFVALADENARTGKMKVSIKDTSENADGVTTSELAADPVGAKKAILSALRKRPVSQEDVDALFS